MLTQDELYRRAAEKWGPDPSEWRTRRRLPHVEALIAKLTAQGCPQDNIRAAMLSSALDSAPRPGPGGWSLAGLCMLMTLDLELDPREIADVMESVQLMRAGRN